MNTDTTPSLVPQSCEAEESVIGSLLINGGCFSEVAAVLQSNDFYIHSHRWIFEACASLISRSMPIDILTVSETLDRSGRLAEMGGEAYLMVLINRTPSSMNVSGYATIVKDASIRRKMLAAANQVARLAYDETQPVDDVVAEAEKAIVQVSCSLVGSKRHETNARDAAGAHYEKTLEAMNAVSNDILPKSGLPDLDTVIGEFQPGDLVIVAGDPGSGKTSLLHTILAHACKEHSGVLFTLEMNTHQVMTRLACIESGMDVFKVKTGKLQGDEWTTYSQAIANIESMKLTFNDTAAITPTQIHAACTRYSARSPLQIIAVDYIQIMGVEGMNKSRNREQEVGEFARSLKKLAREFDATVIAAAQLSRARHQRADKRPMLSDLRESGSQEAEADIVMFLWTANLPDPTNFSTRLVPVDLYVAKHRNGPVGEISLLFNKPSTKFVCAATKSNHYDTYNVYCGDSRSED